MAHKSEFLMMLGLRALIGSALEEIDAPKIDKDWEQAVTICISPDFDVVYATFENWWDDERLSELIDKSWHFETAKSYADALDLAELYFDIR